MSGIHAAWSVLLWLAPALPLLLLFGLAVRRLQSTVLRLLPWVPLPALLLALAAPDGLALEWSWALLGLRLELDPIGRVFLALSAFVWSLGGLHASSRWRAERLPPTYFGAFLAAMAGNLGLILSADLATFYLAFAFMSFAAYGLVVQAGDGAARRAANVYLGTVVVGEILLFAGILLIYTETGSLALAGATGPLAMTLIVAGFGFKAGLIPLHFALPLAYGAAPSSGAVVLGGAMLNAGLLGWLRFLPFGAGELCHPGDYLIVLGLAGALFGALAGLVQVRPRVLLAYSSVSQMGLMLVLLGIGVSTAAPPPLLVAALLAFAVHHALAKTTLFLAVGLGERTGAGSPARRLVLVGLALPALALAGLPFTSGAIAKAGLVHTATHSEVWAGWMNLAFPLSTLLTTLLMGRLAQLVWSIPDGAERAGPGLWLASVIGLAAVAATLWIWPDPAVAALRAVTLEAGLMKYWPILAGALAASVVLRWGRWLGGMPGTIPPGDVLVLITPLIRFVTRLATTTAGAGGQPPTKATHAAARWHARLRAGELAAAMESWIRGFFIALLAFLLLGLVFWLALLPTGTAG